jgi:hypothetical protein
MCPQRRVLHGGYVRLAPDKEAEMATSMSLFLLAVGAILAIAVNYQVQGLDINAVGVILMLVGGLGLLYSLMFLASFAPFRSGRPHDHYDHYDEMPDHRHSHDLS